MLGDLDLFFSGEVGVHQEKVRVEHVLFHAEFLAYESLAFFNGERRKLLVCEVSH